MLSKKKINRDNTDIICVTWIKDNNLQNRNNDFLLFVKNRIIIYSIMGGWNSGYAFSVTLVGFR